MKLDAWLRQEHPLADRLLVVERLSQALNEVHDRGEPLAALQPDRIEVAGDGRCDLSDARRGTPAAAYVAPERAEGGSASPEADVYAAGAIAWEILAGSPCGSSPTHLSEACPDLPQELSDAVMACLERSPQWRPRDLTYLAQLAQHAHGSRKGSEAPATARPARPTARPAAGRSARAGAGRGSSDASAAIRMRLAIGAVLALAAAGGAAYLWSGRPADRVAANPPATTPATRPNALAAATPAAAPSTTLATTPATLPVAPSATAATATPATAGAPPATVVARPTPTPTPRTVAAPATASTETGARPSTPANVSGAGSATTAAAPPLTSPAPAAPAAAQPQAASAAPPPVTAPAPASMPLALSAVSPLSVRRPGKVLLDLRGGGMHDGIRVRVLPLREAPRGISIVRQKCESDTLVRVLLDLDAQVAPTAYAIAIEDADGRQTKPLTFTVTR